MNQTPFSITTDLTPLREFSVEANFDQVQSWLEETLRPYATMIVTPDNLSQCKADRAAIRKVKENLEESRKAVRRAALSACESFEVRCKGLTTLCDQAAGALDGQIKEIDRARRQAKREALEQIFEQTAGDLTGKKLLEFSQVWEESWGNATVSLEKAAALMAQKVEQTREDIRAILALESPYEAAMLQDYRERRHLGRALSLGSQLRELERAMGKREGEKAPGEPMAKPEKPESEKAETLPGKEGAGFAGEKPQGTEERFPLAFRVWVTREEAQGLSAYLRANSIRFEPVE